MHIWGLNEDGSAGIAWDDEDDDESGSQVSIGQSCRMVEIVQYILQEMNN